jgi:hypothetical protein
VSKSRPVIGNHSILGSWLSEIKKLTLGLSFFSAPSAQFPDGISVQWHVNATIVSAFLENYVFTYEYTNHPMKIPAMWESHTASSSVAKSEAFWLLYEFHATYTCI